MLMQIPADGGEVDIGSGDELPDSGLPDVVEIIISVDEDANISDLDLHACNEPGNVVNSYVI